MILIIGGNGFVGSAFVRACLEIGLDHHVVTRENWADLRGTSCRLLINANGNSKKLLSQREPLLDFDLSVRSVRQSLTDFSYDKYVFLSSCDVYPDCSPNAATKEEGTIEVGRQGPYGFHKFLAEQCVRHVARSHLIFRMGGFVGPGLKKNAIYDILHGGPLWLDPQSRLQFISTDFLAKTVLQLAHGRTENETFNICGRGTVSLGQVMAWCGNDVAVMPGAPTVEYEVEIARISRLAEMPSTEETVRNFVSNWGRREIGELSEYAADRCSSLPSPPFAS
jgi:nucleoside-diphosphate-sugar epimerase